MFISTTSVSLAKSEWARDAIFKRGTCKTINKFRSRYRQNELCLDDPIQASGHWSVIFLLPTGDCSVFIGLLKNFPLKSEFPSIKKIKLARTRWLDVKLDQQGRGTTDRGKRLPLIRCECYPEHLWNGGNHRGLKSGISYLLSPFGWISRIFDEKGNLSLTQIAGIQCHAVTTQLNYEEKVCKVMFRD